MSELAQLVIKLKQELSQAKDSQRSNDPNHSNQEINALRTSLDEQLALNADLQQ
jgi:hypothetical protein